MMKKRLAAVCTIILLFLSTSIFIFQQDKTSSNITQKEAQTILELYLDEKDDYTDQYILYPLEVTKESLIFNQQVYIFELCFKDNIPDVGGRLISVYGITQNGLYVYRYNIASNEWKLEYSFPV